MSEHNEPKGGSNDDAEVTITVPTASGGHLLITLSDDCTAADYQGVLRWLERVPWTVPSDEACDEDSDGLHFTGCGCQ